MNSFALRLLAATAACHFAWLGSAAAQQKPRHAEHNQRQQDFVHGAPSKPSTTWLLSAGGRIYDTWWDALDRKKPEGTNPAYPASAQRKGATTWRCVECHGWDYKGKDGLYSSGERFTGITGIRKAKGRDPIAIAGMLRKPPHSYTPDMITDEELQRVAAFVSRGQHNVDRLIDNKTAKVKGDAERGKGFFQTICAACQGFDGRMLDWGTKEEPAYIGTEASRLPHEVLHKMRNSHPGAAMINLRALPLQDAIDILAYAQTLPVK